MATWNALTGWQGLDAAEAKQASQTVEGAKSIGKAGPTGGVAYGADVFTKAAPGQYGETINGVNPDPRFPAGSPEWMAYYAPEYLNEQGQVMRTGGVEVVYGNEGGASVRGLRPTGIRSPWSGVSPGMSEEEIRQWMDQRNFFKTGQGIDPRVLTGMRVDNPFAEQWEPMTASNQYGQLTLGAGPSLFNPYGLNAQYEGTGPSGDPYNYRDNYWGYVQARPDGKVYVPGWNTTASLIGHPSFQPGGPNLYNPQNPNWPWANLPAGTNIANWYGGLTPENQARLERMRNGTSRQNTQGAGSGKWRKLENGHWLHIASGRVYDNKGKLISG